MNLCGLKSACAMRSSICYIHADLCSWSSEIYADLFTLILRYIDLVMLPRR
jgi:hypothetical protein